MNAEEPVVQEPDWIPAGDGRAIGQQDFAINLSPLHAESRFDELSDEIAEEYEEKGKSPEEAERIGDATAAIIGRKKYGNKGMMRMQRKGMRADMVGSPSPTFNEDIMGQDGPSSTPTNASFAAFEGYGDRHDPVKYANDDVKNFRKMADIYESSLGAMRVGHHEYHDQRQAVNAHPSINQSIALTVQKAAQSIGAERWP